MTMMRKAARRAGVWMVLPTAALMLAACSRSTEPAQQAELSPREQKAMQEAQAKAEEAQLTTRWNSLSAEVPEMVDVVTARVDLLERKNKFPDGVDAAEFKGVKEAATTMTQSWQQALGAFANNNMQEAVAAAQLAKDKGSQVMHTLQMGPAT